MTLSTDTAQKYAASLPSTSKHWPTLYKRLARLLTPPPRRDAAAWADAERRLPAHAARGGRWETSFIPIWLPIYAAAARWSTRQVTVSSPRQLGKTSFLENVIAQRFADGPRLPAQLIMETQAKATGVSRDRFRSLIDDTPSLRDITAGGNLDKVAEKWIGGVPLRFAWAGSSGAMSSHSIGLLACDEVNKWPRDVQGEGDGLTIAKGSTTTYINHLVLVTSSPTRDAESAIQDEWLESSMEIAQWACVECGHWHWPLSRDLRYPRDGKIAERAAAARYVCPGCGVELGERERNAMMARPRMWPYEKQPDGWLLPGDAPAPDQAHHGYILSGFFSPFQTLSMLAEKLIKAYASGDVNRIQACLNVTFGEEFAIAGDRPRVDEVRSHMRRYRLGEVPHGVQYIAGGVDVQKDGLYWVVRGFGCEDGPMQSWLLARGLIWGNPAYDDVYIELDATMAEHGARAWWVDSGYKPGLRWARPDHQIYAYVRRQPKARAIRGVRRQGKPVALSPQSITLSGRVIKNGVTLGLVNKTHFMSWLYGRIRNHETESPDLWHLPADIDDDYCAQVVAEEYIIKASGEGYYECPRHRANHYGDCETYATACAWHYLEQHPIKRLGASARPTQPPVAADPAGPAPGVGLRFGRRSAF